MKRLVGEGRGVLILWCVLAVLSVASLAAPALASEGVPAPAVDAPAGRALQEWGLPLTIAELAGLVVVVVPIVMGCVQAAKRFGIEGKGSFALALVLGLVIGGLVVAASLGILPGWAGIAIVILLGGLLAGLAATGIYDLQNKNVKANRAVLDEMRISNALATRAEQRGAGERFMEQEEHVRNLGVPQGYNAGDAKRSAPSPRGQGVQGG